MDFLKSLDRETRKPNNRILNENRNDAAVNNPAERNEKAPTDETWPVDSAVNRAERLESVTPLDTIKRSQRRNDVMFLGK